MSASFPKMTTVMSEQLRDLHRRGDFDALIKTLIPVLSLPPRAQEEPKGNVYGCGDDLCSQMMIEDGHMKNHRPFCGREDAFIRVSPELPSVLTQCPNPPAYKNGKRLAFCSSCIDSHGLHESGTFNRAIVVAGPMHAGESDVAASTTVGGDELYSRLEAESERGRLVGKLFEISEDEASAKKKKKTRAKKLETFEVFDVVACVVLDAESPDGRWEVIAHYWDISKPKPADMNDMDWSRSAEVAQWVEHTPHPTSDAMESASETVPNCNKAPRGKSQVHSNESGEISGPRRSNRLQGQEARLRDSNIPGVEPFAKNGDDTGNEAPIDESAKKRSKDKKQSVDADFVFKGIVAETRNPSGKTQFTCEYIDTSGDSKYFVHESSRISDKAISEFRAKLKRKDFNIQQKKHYGERK
jgi:hypothetical protein